MSDTEILYLWEHKCGGKAPETQEEREVIIEFFEAVRQETLEAVQHRIE